jgi:hypothetical protein
MPVSVQTRKRSEPLSLPEQLQPGGGAESDGSPRPPGLLYKPELRSVAERVKYIEKRNGSGQLSPRLLSPRDAAKNGGDANLGGGQVTAQPLSPRASMGMTGISQTSRFGPPAAANGAAAAPEVEVSPVSSKRRSDSVLPSLADGLTSQACIHRSCVVARTLLPLSYVALISVCASYFLQHLPV